MSREGELSVEEIVQAEIQIIQQAQTNAFSKEYVALMKGTFIFS